MLYVYSTVDRWCFYQNSLSCCTNDAPDSFCAPCCDASGSGTCCDIGRCLFAFRACRSSCVHIRRRNFLHIQSHLRLSTRIHSSCFCCQLIIRAQKVTESPQILACRSHRNTGDLYLRDKLHVFACSFPKDSCPVFGRAFQPRFHYHHSRRHRQKPGCCVDFCEAQVFTVPVTLLSRQHFLNDLHHLFIVKLITEINGVAVF